MSEIEAPAAPRFTGNKARTTTVPLEHHIEYDGKVYTAIIVSRMTVTQVGEFVEAAQAQGGEARLPMFDAPPEVIDALDPDDAENVNKVVRDFLPRSLRPATD